MMKWRWLPAVARLPATRLIQRQFLRTPEPDPGPGSRARLGIPGCRLPEHDDDTGPRGAHWLHGGRADAVHPAAAARVSSRWLFLFGSYKCHDPHPNNLQIRKKVLLCCSIYVVTIICCMSSLTLHQKLACCRITLDMICCSLRWDRSIKSPSLLVLATQRSYGWSRFSAASGLPTQPPPPPYQPPQPQQQQQGQQPSPYALNGPAPGYNTLQPQSQCLLHRSLNCSCLHNARDVSILSRLKFCPPIQELWESI